VLNGTPGYGGEHQIIITREATMDELLLRVEADEAAFANRGAEYFRVEVSHRIQQLLGLRTKAEIVAKGSLPRTDDVRTGG
jgi:phenylacetate-CoA ligase